MKTVFLLVSIFVLNAFVAGQSPLTEKERQSATKFLKDSEGNALKTVANLSAAQLKFKPAADRWSVEDCMMHIAASEKMLWHRTDSVLNASANPEKRADIKWSDEDVMKFIEDRTRKAKTGPPLQPENTGYTSSAEAAASFSENRAKLISFVNATQADLRNHVNTMPFGALDSYQMILFIGAHTNRHVKQMEEVIADPAFPKS